MNLFSSKDQQECLRFFLHKLKEPSFECEARIMIFSNHSSQDFYRYQQIINKFIFSKKLGGYEYKNEQETKLDISWKNTSNMNENEYERITLHGSENVKKYWLCENWKDLSWKWMRKNKIKKYDFEDFPIRLSLSDETELSSYDPSLLKKIPTDWKKIGDELDNSKIVKNYRYKNSYKIYPETPFDDFYFELSAVKMGSGTTFKNSNTLHNKVQYEFEIEWNSKKEVSEDKKTELQKRFKSFSHLLYIILYFYTDSPVLISNSDKEKIVQQYDKFVKQFGEGFKDPNSLNKSNNYYFFVANPVSLHIEQLLKNFKGKGLHEPYALTLKADGERHLFFINENGELYLLNHSLEWKKTDWIIEGFENSLLEGEYISNLELGLVYDVLFYKNKDIRYLPFLTINEKDERIGRFLALDSFDKKIKSLMEEKKKKEGFEKHFMKIISKPYLFSLGKSDKEIFEKSREMWENRISIGYNVDGIIFIPMEESYPKKAGAWKTLYKWKPEEYNTIDFLMKVIRDENGHEKRFLYQKEDKEIYYKVVELFITGVQEEYDPIKKQVIRRYIPVPFTPDEKTVLHIGNSYLNDGFQGTQYARMILDSNDRMLTNDIYKSGEIESDILDDMIVEFVYDRKGLYQEEGFSWIPVRVRHDKTEQYKSGNMIYGNYERTAYDLWKVIKNPVTDDMIFYGNIPSDIQEVVFEEMNENSNSYYDDCDVDKFDFKKRSKMQNFHNMVVKKKLIHSVAPSIISNSQTTQGKFIDLACGKGGDLSKWTSAKFEEVVSLDIDKPCILYAIQYFKRYRNPNKPRVIFLQADTSKPVFPSYEASLGNTFSKKRMEEVIPTKYMFDVASSQFCIHYYFKDELSLRTFLMNVNDCLKMGGKWIGTCFDGKSLFILLKDKMALIGKENMDEETPLWSISKQYKEKTWNPKKPFAKQINVFVKSIGKIHEEFLVDLDVLQEYALEYGLALENIKPFAEYFEEMEKQEETSEDLKVRMNEVEKEFSFFNVSFTFTKVDNIDQSVFEKHKKLMSKNK